MYLMTRKHPEYAKHESAWNKALDAYSGGESYICKALKKHIAEIDIEFAERLARACYFNYPRKIARLITQYALALEPKREKANPELIEDWNRSGLRVNEVMRQVSTILNVCGQCWLFVGMPEFEGAPDAERVQRERLRPYCNALSPLAVVDWAYGHDGRLLWALIEDTAINNTDPCRPPAMETFRVLWERDQWTRVSSAPGSVEISGRNPLGVVPLIRITEPDGFGLNANHWFEDVVRISDAILNNQSEAQMNIVKQMFGLLVVGESFFRDNTRYSKHAGDDQKPETLSAVIARSAAVSETGDEKGVTRYIAPSGVESATIREENARLKQELYDVVGLAIQSSSKEAQTAESKAWDFQNISQFLSSRADLLEQAERAAWQLMAMWDKSINIPDVTYNREFAVVDFEKAVSALIQTASLPNIGIEYQKQLARTGLELIERITPIPSDKKRAIEDEIDRMEPAPIPDFSFGGSYGNVDNQEQQKEDI